MYVRTVYVHVRTVYVHVRTVYVHVRQLELDRLFGQSALFREWLEVGQSGGDGSDPDPA
jgi:hypothetical protein